jgi:hypothetical protein
MNERSSRWWTVIGWIWTRVRRSSAIAPRNDELLDESVSTRARFWSEFREGQREAAAHTARRAP